MQGNKIEEVIDEGKAMDVDRDTPDALDMLGEVEGSQQQMLQIWHMQKYPTKLACRFAMGFWNRCLQSNMFTDVERNPGVPFHPHYHWLHLAMSK